MTQLVTVTVRTPPLPKRIRTAANTLLAFCDDRVIRRMVDRAERGLGYDTGTQKFLGHLCSPRGGFHSSSSSDRPVKPETFAGADCGV